MPTFQETFPKNHRPAITDLQNFFTPEVSVLFRDLSDWLLETFSLSFAVPVWSEKNGWTYRLGWSGVYLITGITIQENGFHILGQFVCDQASYTVLRTELEEFYRKEKEAFQQKITDKNRKQAERNQQRVKKEAEQQSQLAARIIEEKYNRFRWPAKLNINRLKQLYRKDSEGLRDEELADDIGFCLYVRCKYGKEDMQLLNQYQLRCHHCDAILTGTEDFRECSCGYQYSYREYRRSFRRNNMPTGAASTIFNQFIEQWPQQKDYEGKMLTIDKLLHEFHLNLVSGAVHRPVAMNFMDGTREQIETLINELAYQ